MPLLDCSSNKRLCQLLSSAHSAVHIFYAILFMYCVSILGLYLLIISALCVMHYPINSNKVYMQPKQTPEIKIKS